MKPKRTCHVAAAPDRATRLTVLGILSILPAWGCSVSGEPRPTSDDSGADGAQCTSTVQCAAGLACVSGVCTMQHDTGAGGGRPIPSEGGTSGGAGSNGTAGEGGDVPLAEAGTTGGGGNGGMLAEAGTTGGTGNGGAGGAGNGGMLAEAGTTGGAGGALPSDGGAKPEDPTICGTQPYSQWTQTYWTAGKSFFHLEASRGQVFARIWDSLTGGRMFLTTDKGANWVQIGSADTDLDLLSVITVNGGMLAASWEGFYQSISGGTAWNAVAPTGAPASAAILSIARIGTTLFASTTGDVYQSADDGSTWTDAGSGLPANALITSVAAYGETILAGTQSSGVFAMPGGGNWTAVNSGLADTHIAQLAVVGTKVFAVTLGGVFVSENGTSWVADSASPANTNCMLVVNGQLLAGTDDTGVYLSVDSGGTWTPFTSGMPAATRVWSLAASSDSLFAGTDSGVWRAGCNP